MNAKVEVQVQDKCVSIWYKGLIVFRMWETNDGVGHGNCPHPETVQWDESVPPFSGARNIEVHALIKDQDPLMALPRLSSHRIEADEVFAPAQARRSSSSSNSGGPLIDTTARDLILNSVIDSMLVNPNSTKVDDARVSHEIADRLGVRIGSVAAVRANLTRGTYGDPDNLISTRKTWLMRNEPERMRQMIDEAHGCPACYRPAGEGTGHYGEGPCSRHETPPAPDPSTKEPT